MIFSDIFLVKIFEMMASSSQTNSVNNNDQEAIIVQDIGNEEIDTGDKTSECDLCGKKLKNVKVLTNTKE